MKTTAYNINCMATLSGGKSVSHSRLPCFLNVSVIREDDMSKFYVYIHRRADNQQPFYVGKGVGKRDGQTDKRTVHWKRVFNKYGRTIERVAEFENEQDAFDLEIALIDFIGRIDEGSGPLVNKTAGGEGVSGLSEEARIKKGITSSRVQGTPEMRKQRSEAFKAMWAKDRDKMIASQNTPKSKANRYEGAKRRWADPEKRKQLMLDRAKTNDARLAKIKATKSTPEWKLKQSASIKKLWQDPAYREKQIAAFNTPESLAKKAQTLQDPANKEKRLAALKSAKTRAKMSESAKNRYRKNCMSSQKQKAFNF